MSTISIPEGIRALLATGPLGHIVTLDPDGSPHVSIARVGLDGDELLWSTFSDQRKIANLRRDPRIAVSCEAHEAGDAPLHPYVVFNGRARIEEGGALEVMDRLAPAYMGPGARFPMRDVPPGFTIRVTIERIYGQGPWKEAR
jgi:PPOX class probable F420-dependent enzyme